MQLAQMGHIMTVLTGQNMFDVLQILGIYHIWTSFFPSNSETNPLAGCLSSLGYTMVSTNEQLHLGREDDMATPLHEHGTARHMHAFLAALALG